MPEFPEYTFDARIYLVLVPPMLVWGIGLLYLERLHLKRTGESRPRLWYFVYLTRFNSREWKLFGGLVAVSAATGWASLLIAIELWLS
jgi:hypothetical protein